MPVKIKRSVYADMFGPTTGDKVRLADTDLIIEVEKDFTIYGEEVKFGGGKVIRDGMGQSQATRAQGAVDTVITNALIVDHWGIVKADVAIKDGMVHAIGKAGNPDIQPGVTINVGPGTDVIAGEGKILTAGGFDSHIHFICPQQIEHALMSGVTSMLGGGTGPSHGTFATTCTPGPWHIARMIQSFDAFPVNIGISGKGNAAKPAARNFGGQLDTSFDSYDKSWVKTGTTAFRFGDFAAMISASQRSYSEGTLSKARADGGIYGCPRPAEAIRCNQLNPLDGDDVSVLNKLVWTPDNQNEVKFTAEFLNKNAVVDQRHDLGLASGIRNLSYIRQQIQSRERYTLAHKYTPNLGWIDHVRWQVSQSYQERDFTGVRNRQLANGQFDQLDYLQNYKEQFTEGDLQLNSSFDTPFARHVLTYGMAASVAETDYLRRDITTNLNTRVVTIANAGGFNFADATTTRVDGFIQDEISLLNNRWILTPGIRYATYEMNPRPNPFYRVVVGKEPRDMQSEKLLKQFGSVFKLDENFSLVGRYAEGFKMPTAQQLFTSVPGGGGGNSDLIPAPNLRPEQVKSYELGLRGQFSQGFFSATAFKADYTDFIQSFVEVPSINYPGIFDITYQNLSKVNLWGLEFAGEYRFNDYWSTNLSMAYTQGNQRATATTVETRTFKVGASYAF